MNGNRTHRDEFRYRKGLAYYIPISENQEEAKKTLEIFRPFLRKEIFKIAHNLKLIIKF